MLQQLLSLSIMCVFKTLVDFREGVGGYPDYDGHYRHAGEVAVQQYSNERPDEHHGQHYKSILIAYHWLVVICSLHLVNKIAERGTDDAGEDSNCCIFG